MKKLMIFALGVAAVLASCVKNEVEDISKPEEIAFKEFAISEGTRADDKLAFTHDYFRVYAKFSNKGDGSDYKDFWGAAAKKIVKKNDAYWAAEDKTYYWPKAGAISFWGYYFPEDQTSVNLSLDTTVGVGIKGTGVTAAQAALILLANPAESELETANTVPIIFRHVGSQVIFRFANASINDKFALTITGVEITEAMDKGDFTYTTWDNYSVETTYTSTQSHAVENAAIADAADAYTFFTLPQKLKESGANKQIVVKYRVADNNAGYYYDGVYTADATDWNINTKHYYNITFNFTAGEEIKFAPSVEKWASSDETDKDFAVND